MPWDRDALHRRFLMMAQNAEHRLNETRAKVRTNTSYKSFFDAALAEFYVYNRLHGRTWLESRQELLRALKETLNGPTPSTNEPFDKELFAQFWRNILKSLIEEFSGATTSVSDE